MGSSQSILQTKTIEVAIVGNPNVGKSTIFNQLTGLKQKIGNYPGVTVDKTVGSCEIKNKKFSLIDLPGTYSLHPNSEDEVIAHRVLNSYDQSEHPDYAMVIADASNLERGLLLCSQIMDLGIPMALVINMVDLAEKNGIEIKAFSLFKSLGIPILLTDARKPKGIEEIKDLLYTENFLEAPGFIKMDDILSETLSNAIQSKFGLKTSYQAFQLLGFQEQESILKKEQKDWLEALVIAHDFNLAKAQIQETEMRFGLISKVLEKAILKKPIESKNLTRALDKILIHQIGGYAVFLGIMLVIFQAVFSWAEFPMDLIDGLFANISQWLTEHLPAGALTSLLAEGIVPGIGGIMIFIPQIALLFGFLAILEGTGYMSRVVFLMDRLMRPFGLHGKSVVPLVSGVACAIPGIMATRNISNSKERLITILVTPFMSCSARLPVYIILIGLAVPNENYGFVNLQALTLLSMYILGIVAVLASAWILNKILKTKEKSYLIIELPIYRIPGWKDVLITMYSKSKTFVVEAGKVIMAISIILWVLASYGPSERMTQLDTEREVAIQGLEGEALLESENKFASKKLEASYIGILGKTIEPVIRPLGYDWKIGIALITSFAAREVFVSTIATIYSIGGDVDNELTIREKLAQETDPITGAPIFNTATVFSLMVFYAFAMQCMSTLAVVYRETKSWKWPVIQTVFMTGLAYFAALITYQLLS
ncbi:ferrous iron transport protein B [Rhodonellum sp.]|uniref:ferrous iron transport protein B n=1 Tax=Rhodonellum sp. TaxID=2231180 RepID=UPI00271B4659|nr:ferrous iron transport protein B [Rhodonellum sp.]MDO9553239.1 ferrous iron transport protein B [Rhodonellum sp.]